MSLLRQLKLVMMAIALGGCASFPFPYLGGDIDGRVNNLVAHREYGDAMAILAYVPDNHPRHKHFEQRMRQVKALAAVYENEMIRRAHGLTSDGKWNEALQTYREALRHIPRSDALRDDLKAFREKQATRVRDLHLEMLIAKGKWLRKALALQTSVTGIDSESWGEANRLDDLRYQAKSVAERLTEKGLEAMSENDLSTAGRTLPLAAELNPTSETKRAEQRLAQADAERIGRQRARKERAREQYRVEQTQQLRSAFEQARSSGDLHKARELMNQLLEISDDPEVRQLSDQFAEELDRILKKKLHRAASLYSQGRIETAMKGWHEILRIAPDNEEAQANLERAERVMERLHQLREKQTVPTAFPGQ